MADTAPEAQRNTQRATPASSGQLFIRDGFLWDRQDAYLFDIDGTLLRSQDRVHYNSFAHSVRRVMGQELVLEGVSVHGSTDTAILRDAFKASNIDESEWKPQLEPVLELMRATVTEQRDSLRPYQMPGVESTLRHLRIRGLCSE
jgi:phosphoglycolate phosphatase